MRLVIAIALILLAPPVVGQTQPGAAVPRAPDDGGPRRWQVVEPVMARKSPAPTAAEAGTLAAGTIVRNQGCDAVDGTVWCRVAPLARRGTLFVPAGALAPAAGPDGTVPTGPDDSKSRARKRQFDADGQVPCAQEVGQNLGTCKIGVARSGGGDATAVVTFPNGFSRILYFVHGTFIGANATMSGVGTDIDWSVEAGLYKVRVDDQRFDLPATLLFGE